MKKWVVLKVVWNIALMTILVWISLIASQNLKLLNLGFGIVTDNQGIIEQKIMKHDSVSCKKINL
mgnify:FL=1